MLYDEPLSLSLSALSLSLSLSALSLSLSALSLSLSLSLSTMHAEKNASVLIYEASYTLHKFRLVQKKQRHSLQVRLQQNTHNASTWISDTLLILILNLFAASTKTRIAVSK